MCRSGVAPSRDAIIAWGSPQMQYRKFAQKFGLNFDTLRRHIEIARASAGAYGAVNGARGGAARESRARVRSAGASWAEGRMWGAGARHRARNGRAWPGRPGLDRQPRAPAHSVGACRVCAGASYTHGRGGVAPAPAVGIARPGSWRGLLQITGVCNTRTREKAVKALRRNGFTASMQILVAFILAPAWPIRAPACSVRARSAVPKTQKPPAGRGGSPGRKGPRARGRGRPTRGRGCLRVSPGRGGAVYRTDVPDPPRGRG